MGTTLSTATQVYFDNKLTQSFTGHLNQSEPDAYYRLDLQKRSDVIALLTDLNSNANLYIVNAQGNQVSLGGVELKSENSSLNSELINVRAMSPAGNLVLNPGTYYLKVSLATGVNDPTSFRLSININYDRAGDIVFHNPTTGVVNYVEMNGTSFGPTTFINSVTGGWRILATSDMNNDNVEDLIFYDFVTGDAGYWYLNPDHTLLGTTSIPSPGVNSRIVGARDVNLDGKNDLIIFDLAANQLKAWLMNNATRTSIVSFPSDIPDLVQYPSKLVAGVEDINFDDIPDLLVEDQLKPHTLAVHFMDGLEHSMLFEMPIDLTLHTPAAWYLRGVADFDNDGINDFISFNFNDETLRFTLMQNIEVNKQILDLKYTTGFYPTVIKKTTPPRYLDVKEPLPTIGVEIASPFSGSATYKDVIGTNVKVPGSSTGDTQDLYYFDTEVDNSSFTVNLTMPSSVSWSVREGSPTGILLASGTGSVSQTFTNRPNDRYFIGLQASATPAAQYTLQLSMNSSSMNSPTTVDTILVGNQPSNPRNFTRIAGGDVLFIADSDQFGSEVFQFDQATGQVYVLDIVPGQEGSDPTELVPSNGRAYFVATDANGDRELYYFIEGSAPDPFGSVIKIDVNPTGSSNPTNLMRDPYLNGPTTIYFSAYTETFGREPWMVRRQAGANQVRLAADINVGSGSSLPSNFVLIGDSLVLAAENPEYGRELFRLNEADDFITDTTPEVININPDTPTSVNSSNPESTVSNRVLAVDGNYYFAATRTQGTNIGRELFRLNASTFNVTSYDINPGSASSNPENITLVGSVNPAVYFSASTATQGRELGRINLTTGVQSILDIRPGSDSSSPTQITGGPNESFQFAYFAADKGTNNYQVYRVGDASSSVQQVGSDINPTGSATPYNFVLTQNRVYFTASDLPNGRNQELYWSNIATNSNPTKVEIRPSVGSINSGSNPTEIFDYGPFGSQYWVFVAASTKEHGNEPFRFQESDSSVQILRDINQAPRTQETFTSFVKTGSARIFTGPSDTGENQLWISTGDNPADTNPLSLSPSSDVPASVHSLVNLGNRTYGIGFFSGKGYELFRLDTTVTPAVLTRLTDIAPGDASSSITNLTPHSDGFLYFSAFKQGTGSDSGNGLWRVNASTTQDNPEFIARYTTDVSKPIQQILSVPDLYVQPGTQPALLFVAWDSNLNRYGIFSRDNTGIRALKTRLTFLNEELKTSYVRHLNQRDYIDLRFEELENFGFSSVRQPQLNTPIGKYPVVFVNGYPTSIWDNTMDLVPLEASPKASNYRYLPYLIYFHDGDGYVEFRQVPFFNDLAVYKNALYGASEIIGVPGRGVQRGTATRPFCSQDVIKDTKGWEPYGVHYGGKGFYYTPLQQSKMRSTGQVNPESSGYARYPFINLTLPIFHIAGDNSSNICIYSTNTEAPQIDINKTPSPTITAPTFLQINPKSKYTKGSGAYNFHSLNNGYITFLANDGISADFQLYAIRDMQTNSAYTTDYGLVQITTNFAGFKDFVVKDNLGYFIAKPTPTAQWQVFSTDGQSVLQRTTLSANESVSDLNVLDGRVYYTVYNLTTKQSSLRALL